MKRRFFLFQLDWSVYLCCQPLLRLFPKGTEWQLRSCNKRPETPSNLFFFQLRSRVTLQFCFFFYESIEKISNTLMQFIILMQYYKLVFKGKSEGDDAFFFRFYLQFSYRDRSRFWSFSMYICIAFRTFGYHSYCLI